MLHIRFDPDAGARLALVWTEPESPVVSTDYARAADLLFSVIGDNAEARAEWWPTVRGPQRRNGRKASGAASKARPRA